MLKLNRIKQGLLMTAVAAGIATVPAAHAALASYSQDWEGFNATFNTDAAAISADGFVIGNVVVNTGAAWFNGNAAPNNAADGLNGYSSLVQGEGDAGQGTTQLSIFNDYNPWSPFTAGGTTLQTYTYRDVGTLAADDVGKTYRFSFDGKLGGLDPNPPANGSAYAYISVLKSSDGSFAELFNGQFDSGAGLTGSWGGGFVDVTIDPAWDGELLQIGFANEATDWGGTGVFYDNLNFAESAAVPVPAAVWLFGAGIAGLAGVARRRKS